MEKPADDNKEPPREKDVTPTAHDHENASYEAGFGSMLLEPHPSRGFEHRGQFVHTHRYSLCFAPYVLYEPKSAEELAALRISRERGKAEREAKRFLEESPLLAWAGL